MPWGEKRESSADRKGKCELVKSGLGPFEKDRVYHGDALRLLPLIPPCSIDLVVTDPPFAIDFRAQKLNYNRTGGNVLEGYAEIDPDEYGNFTSCWLREAYRVLSDSGSLYVFSGWNRLKDSNSRWLGAGIT